MEQRPDAELGPVESAVDDTIAELAKQTVSEIRNPEREATRQYRQKRNRKNKTAAASRKRNRRAS